MRFTGDKTTVRKAFAMLNEKGKPFTDSADSMPSSARSCTGVSVSSSHSNVNTHQQLAAAEEIAEIRNDSTSISMCDSQTQIMPKDTAIIKSQERDQLQVKTIATACKLPSKEELSTGTGEETSASAKLSMENLKYDAKACLTMVLYQSQKKPLLNPKEIQNWLHLLVLSVSDRDEIADGVQLSDKHINFVQKITKFQFSLQGLQSKQPLSQV